MDERDRAADLAVLQRAEPAGLRGRTLSIQARIAWTTRMSASRVTTVSPPGRGDITSAAIEPTVLWIQSASDAAEAATWMIRGSTSTRLRAAGWSKRTAPQTMVEGAPPPPWRRIS